MTELDLQNMTAALSLYTSFFIFLVVITFAAFIILLVILIHNIKSRKNLTDNRQFLEETISVQEEVRRRISQELRAIIHNLAVPALASVPFKTVINDLCEQFYEQSKIPCKFFVESGLSLNSFTTEQKHHILRIMIFDDGQGFDFAKGPHHGDSTTHFGMSGDEIQECPRARTAIKFLVEDGRFDYIESGSLLGVNYKEVPSYPVGFEHVIQMFPLDFEEFCWANGVQKETLENIQNCFEENTPVIDAVHQKMMQLFRYYIIVGGMPAVVQSFVDNHDIARAVNIQKDILALYRQDITKYAQKDKERIKEIFDRIPSELNSKNRRFMLSDINPHARMNRYESSFMWLSDAGVTLPCYNLTSPVLPFKTNEQRNLMKVYMNDTGLLCAMTVGNVQFEILQGNLEINMGSIVENIIAQQLVSNGFELRYFDKKSVCELDFLVQKSNSPLALEIKSGKDYHRHAALEKALSSEEWNLSRAIVFCSGNIEKAEKITYCPLYMIQFLKADSLPESLIVEVDLP